MQQKTVQIPNISCGHCTMRVEKALNGLDGVITATADVATQRVTIEWDDAVVGWEAIAAALNEIGYPADDGA